MNNWQARINNIVENERTKQEKIKDLQYLRYKVLEDLHILEDYVNKIDYCIHNLRKE